MTESVFDLLRGIAGEPGIAAAAETELLTALELLTVDPDGWPHVAWLGPGEVSPVDENRVALAVWPGSSTRRNLGHGRAVLQAVVEGTVYRIRLDIASLGPVPVGGSSLAGFLGLVTGVITDKVAYAEVSSGLTYRLLDPQSVLARWAEQAESLAGVATSWLEQQNPEAGET